MLDIGQLPNTPESERIVELYNLDVTVRNKSVGNAVATSFVWSGSLLIGLSLCFKWIRPSPDLLLLALAVPLVVFIYLLARNIRSYREQREHAQTQLNTLLLKSEYREAASRLQEIYDNSAI